MIFVDTSVWIEYFDGRRGVVEALDRLLDEDRVALAAPVRLELLTGVSGTDLARFRRLLSAIPLFVPSGKLWPALEAWVEVARRRGERFGIADLLIAGIVAENDGSIWSFDSDFARMARLGFVRVYPDGFR